MAPTPSLIRFHLDESRPSVVAKGLRKRDRDITTPNDAALLAATDPEHFSYAKREGRVILTRDDDFIEIAMQSSEHPGVVFWTEKRPVGKLIVELDNLCFDCTAKDLVAQVLYL